MKKFISLVTIFIFFNACASSTTPRKTQLEIREYQTRYFEVKDKNLVMKAVVNTLMDEGYIIKNANNDLGIVTAEKAADVTKQENEVSSSKPSKIGLIVIGALVILTLGLIILLSKDTKDSEKNKDRGTGSGSEKENTYEKSRIIETTISVGEFSNGYKVRAIFQYKLFDNKGNLVRTDQIDNVQFYQNFFSKLDKSIFLQKEYENR